MSLCGEAQRPCHNGTTWSINGEVNSQVVHVYSRCPECADIRRVVVEMLANHPIDWDAIFEQYVLSDLNVYTYER